MSFEESSPTPPTPKEITKLLLENKQLKQKHEVVRAELVKVQAELAKTKEYLEWFKKQYFGQKSERRLLATGAEARQLWLAEFLPEEAPPPKTETVREYERRTNKEESIKTKEDESGLRFDDSVPVETIEVPVPEIQGLEEGKDYKVISEKVTHRLAQRPSYVVLRYVRKVVKLESEKIITPAAPRAVIEKSYADVSFLAGLLIDKFQYHLPLYRQHQRLRHCGIELSRQTLTNLVHRTVNLLSPVYYAQLSSILQSKVLAMDETPVKAGRKEKGKLHQGYFWPIYGDKDEVAFPYSPSRAAKTVREVLGNYCGVLLTDGYEAYERYAAKQESTVHAQCWSHTRRAFLKAEKVEPELVSEALSYIRALYEIEDKSRDLEDEERLQCRGEHSKRIVDEFFAWLEKTAARAVLLSSSPFTKAACYALRRRDALSVFLSDPHVALDTNHLERALRPIPMGRKNWLFCWSECGAEVVGKIQSLIMTCRLHHIDTFTYLIDVLQRIDTHRIHDVHLLTPRLWKENFASCPLRSDVQRMDADVKNAES